MQIATLEVDGEAVYEALDRKRRRLRLLRRDVAALLGVSPPSYHYWSRGGGIAADALVRACIWLDRDPREFARDSAEQPRKSRDRDRNPRAPTGRGWRAPRARGPGREPRAPTSSPGKGP